jgi:hypothetical protein
MSERFPRLPYSPRPSQPPADPPRRRVNPWTVVAIVLAVALAVAGLAVLGVFVFLFMAMGSYGSNK